MISVESVILLGTIWFICEVILGCLSLYYYKEAKRYREMAKEWKFKYDELNYEVKILRRKCK